MTTPTRDELAAMITARCDVVGSWWDAAADVVLPLLAEKDARIAELDESIADFQQLAVDRTAERDAALAAATGSAKLALAWRACAEQLAACVNHPFSRWADSSEALAVYERLRS